MLCSSPMPYHGRRAPCGRCTDCRRSRQAVLVSRLLVEGFAHLKVSMLTLTYSALPEGGSLVPADLVGGIKRLRINYQRALARDPLSSECASLRFFACGEYGGQFGRPHHHLICYGADRSTWVNGEPFSSLVRRSWGHGSTHLGGGWSSRTAAYVSGYVAKGLTTSGLAVLGGRHPEFSRWPNAPALGVPGLPELLHRILGGRSAREVIAVNGDLPSVVHIDGRPRVVGGLLMDRLRSMAGMTPAEIRAAKLLLVRLATDYAHAGYLASALPVAEALNDQPMVELISSMMGGFRCADASTI